MAFNQILINSLRSEENISITPGLARAILPEEVEKGGKHFRDYYQWVSNPMNSSSREYKTALVERIQKPLENDILVVRNDDGSTKFDDRKIRFSGYTFDGRYQGEDEYTIRVGPTHFGELQSVDKVAVNDLEFREKVMNLGVEKYKDERAYLANVLSVSALPITKDNEPILFKRSSKAELYPSHWHIIGRQLDPDEDNYDLFSGSYASDRFRNLLRSNMEREILEEMAINPNEVNLKLRMLTAGINIGFDYFAKIDLSSEEILNRISHAKDKKEHDDFLFLDGKEELENFLNSGEKMVPEGELVLKDYVEQRKYGLI